MGAYAAGREGNRRRRELSPAQALVLGFAGAVVVGTALLAAPWSAEPGRSVSLLDAFFTATSAVTVTGLTVVPTGATFSTLGEIVIMVLIQAGGLGIMTMSVLFALLLGKRIGLRERLLMQEALQQATLAGIVRLLRLTAVYTLAVEAMGALLLAAGFAARGYPTGTALYLGLFHSIAAFNNAGFDLFGNSFMGFATDPLINFTLMGLIVLGGIGFGTVADVLQRLRNPGHRLTLHTQLVLWTTGLLLLAGWLAVALLEWHNPRTLGALPLWARPMAALFHSVTPRTAGFNTLDTGSLLPTTLVITLMLMFIGASPGSTGGGIKTTTAAAVGLAVWAVLRREEDIVVLGRRLPRDTADRAMAVALLSLALVLAVATFLTLTEQADFLALLFEAVSAFATVGLSTGITPQLSPPGKVAIALLMFAGRVGPLTLAFALARRALRGPAFRYPEERIMIG